MTRRKVRVRLTIHVRELDFESLPWRAEEALQEALRGGGGTRTKTEEEAQERAREAAIGR